LVVHSNVVTEKLFDLLLAVLMTLNLAGDLDKMVQVGIVCAVEESTGLQNYLLLTAASTMEPNEAKEESSWQLSGLFVGLSNIIHQVVEARGREEDAQVLLL
jgi:hypothetical protein